MIESETYWHPKSGDWPSCPKCGSKIMVSGGSYAACPSCSYFESASELHKSPVGKIARTRMVSRPEGHRGVIVFSPTPIPATMQGATWERCSQVAQRIVHENVWLAARNKLGSSMTFSPFCTMNYGAEDYRYVSLPLSSPALAQQARRYSSPFDVTSVMWAAPDDQNKVFSIEQAKKVVVPDSGFLMVNTHFYGSPSLVTSFPYTRQGSTVKMGKQRFYPEAIPSWINQPVQWGAIPIVPGRIQPRLVMIREVPGKVNVSGIVCEDLDGPPICRIATFRPKGEYDPVVIPIEASSCEEGISIVRKRMEQIDSKLDKDDVVPEISFEKEWSIDADPLQILLELKMADFWKDYAGNR